MRLSTDIGQSSNDHVRMIFTVLGLIGIITVTALAYYQSQGITQDEPGAEAIRPPSQQEAGQRFRELNILPGDPGTYPVMTQRELRFLGRNILPGDPGTFPVTTQREWRFRDWNVLPGDDQRLVPPIGDFGKRF